MAASPSDPDRYRRQQRRRAWIAWIGALAVIALIAVGAIFGGNDDGGGEGELVRVPYGDEMSSAEYEAIEEGESQAQVLTDLNKTGRPESLTEDYVLVLFPPATDSVECTYWEFTDEPQIFARLCFSSEDRELVQKLEHDVHGGGGEGTNV